MSARRLQFLILLALAPVLATASDSFREDYDYALQSLERGQFEAAANALESAVAKQPMPQLSNDPSTTDYLPWLHLAIARHELGNHADARIALDRAGSYALATQSYLGRRIWDRYALIIMATADVSSADSDAQPVDFREFERQEFMLTDAETEDIRRQVLRRCALGEKVESARLPWYFHYEFGLELMRAGDAQRALDMLLVAANQREESRRQSRMYGMWFTDYLPYYQIALAHSKLGNWRCAMDAMRISATFGEFSPVDSGYQEYSDLQKLIARQNQKQDG